MEALQAQYDATARRAAGRGAAPAERTLRAELGDADYERYLHSRSVGRRRTGARRARELAGRARGPRAGRRDRRLRRQTRLRHAASSNALTLEGTPGESVVVEVRRDGQNVQLVMPRGPIGIIGGGFRGR